MNFVTSLKTAIVGILTAVTTTAAPLAPVPALPLPVASASAQIQASNTPLPLPLTLTGDNHYYIRGVYSYYGQSIKYHFIIPQKGGSFSGSIDGACNATVGGEYTGGNGGKIYGGASGICNIPFIKYKGSVNYTGHLYPEEKKIVIQVENTRLVPIVLSYN